MNTIYEYDGFGRVIAVVDGNGVRMPIEYDALGRVLRQGTTAFDYDARGNRIAQHDVGNTQGHRREMTYDSLGRVGSVTEWRNVNGFERAVTTRRAYDVFGNLIIETKGNGATSQTLFGGYGRQNATIDADGRAITFGYDDFGRQTEESGAGGRNIRRSYDDAGHLVEIRDLVTGVTTTYGYDIMGRRVSETTIGVIDFEGRWHNRELSYGYDAMGRMTHWHDAATGLQETITYDAAGNQARVQGYGGGTSVDHSPSSTPRDA